MASGSRSDQEIECLLLWKLARAHGWSGKTDVSAVVSDSTVQDEQRGRQIARIRLASRGFVTDLACLPPPDTPPSILTSESHSRTI